jgi:hypothetical protein
LKGKAVVPLFLYHEQEKSSVTLVKGDYDRQDDLIYSSLGCASCHNGGPKLVCVHHVDPTLRLYGCDRCRDYLVKVKVPEELLQKVS